MIREGDKSMEKLKKLMNSYVPEFAYEPGASDPGSVLTDLCAEMIGTCEERYSRVLSKHRIQYLNLFDPLIQEPVSASRGYVQFQPVKGYEGMVPIPAGTSVIASHPDAGSSSLRRSMELLRWIRYITSGCTDRFLDQWIKQVQILDPMLGEHPAITLLTGSDHLCAKICQH